MSENNQTYTKEEIKQAFWDTFHRAGDVWFDYLSDEERCNRSTFSGWMEFYENLTGEWLNDDEEE